MFVGIAMAKGDHYAQANITTGGEFINRPVANDETAITGLVADAGGMARGCCRNTSSICFANSARSKHGHGPSRRRGRR